ncbi:MAG: MarR family winged helix-turn-helix transcriptional regulator [Lysobacterales bacterium]
MTLASKATQPDNASLAISTEAWLAVVKTYNECTATLSKRLAPLGLSVLEHEVLMNLLRSNTLTQRQLSQRCFSAKSGISMLVARFEADGLVHRRRCPEDQRAWSLSLTPKGQKTARKALAVQAEVVSAMAEAFSDAELTLVKSRMTTAAAALKNLRES